MWYGILLVSVLLIGTILLILFARKSHLQTKQKIGLTIISLFALFGFFVVIVLFFSVINPKSYFKAKLGHYAISHFSESYDMIGRLTVQEKDGKLVVFPGNQERKMVGLYKDGAVWTAWLENGELTIVPNTAVKPSLWNVLFEK